MNPEAANLRAICEAMDQHARNCGEPLVAIYMAPWEVSRLDWPEVRGVPVKPDEEMGTGRFRLVCSGQHDEEPSEVEAVAKEAVA